MICLGLAGESMTDSGEAPVGQMLASYDPDAYEGYGEATWTRDPALAMIFPHQLAVLATWKVIPMSRPRRPDGQPNRPLTVFTIEARPIDE